MMSHNESHSQFINKGYVLLVGHTTTSQSNNAYFDIIIQTAVEDTARVRLMNDGNVEQEDFVQLTTPEMSARGVVFKSVVETGDFYFFSAKAPIPSQMLLQGT